jgi:hypothetical protein
LARVSSWITKGTVPKASLQAGFSRSMLHKAIALCFLG